MSVLFATVLVAASGCAAFENKMIHTMHKAALDDRRTIELTQHVQRNALLRGPRHNYDELSVWAAFNQGVRSRVVVARYGSADLRSAPRFEFGPLEARAHADRKKLWFVDADAARVVASVDCETRAVTGPEDEPPPWATVEGGICLERIECD